MTCLWFTAIDFLNLSLVMFVVFYTNVQYCEMLFIISSVKKVLEVLFAFLIPRGSAQTSADLFLFHVRDSRIAA
jgi:hypothetical protein